MNHVTKVLSGAALGTIISLSSLTSAHAAVVQQSDTHSKIEVKAEQVSVSKATAQKTALKKCKGTVTSTKLQKEGTVYVYTITILGEDGNAHTVKVSGESGKVVKQQIQKKQVAITKTKAHSIALKKYKGTVTSSKLKKENGVYVYIVSIHGQDGNVHTVKINSESGKVVKQETQKKQVSITKEKAHSVALKKCKGIVTSSKLKKENGVYVYIVNILGQDGNAHTVKVNCKSGKAVNHVIQKKQAAITKEKAQSVALKTCKGTVTSSELKKESGRYIYIIKIEDHKQKEHTVKVNATSGTVCS
ncbi:MULTISPECIES: PepSY domain-containing protein [Bacillus]|uniref:PepSY domain-containing protein n=1 Tax=Bacillus TaxID=1386 RepID=UPI0015841141|nr:PepSY domain-containing protein [Bacillus glycinifermentans]MBU8788399.1 PepSY domain-containing protein [Bacillus glycinifermentans]NUJ18623.1 peptidase [Bacillus glycinifermentans]